MMAHELPRPIHQEPKKPLKQRHVAGKAEKVLPNGEAPDFGHSSNKNNNSTKNSSKDKKSNSSAGSGNSKSSRKKNTSPGHYCLPNGEKPDFGDGAPKSKNKKDKEMRVPTLPNGEKPDFGNGSEKEKLSSKQKNRKDRDLPEPSLPNGSKVDFGNNPTDNLTTSKKLSNKDKKKSSSLSVSVSEDSYAGSSFHSSPSALALPKPSFKTLPKQSTAKSIDVSSPAGVSTALASGNTMPARGGVAPPRYPAAAYPLGSGFPMVPLHSGQQQPQVMMLVHPPPPPLAPYIQQGFTYQVTPQGYIQYPFMMGQGPSGPMMNQGQFPPGAMPVPPQPQANSGQPVPQQVFTSHFQPGVSPPQPSQMGHKISFNELIDSSKK